MVRAPFPTAGITVFLLIPEGAGILGEFQVHLRPFTDAFAQFAAGSGIPGAGGRRSPPPPPSTPASSEGGCLEGPSWQA